MSNKDLLAADLWWFHLFRSFISSGDLSKMNANTVKVYVALKSTINIDTGTSSAGLDWLARNTGLSLSSVKRAIRELKTMEYIFVTEKPGRSNNYTFIERFPVIDKNKKAIVGTASFPYIPSETNNRRSELKSTLQSGNLDQTPQLIKVEINIDNTLLISGENISINGPISNGITNISSQIEIIGGKIGEILTRNLQRTGHLSDPEPITDHSEVLIDPGHD